jgi:transcriptional regulator with XRE-family HTH domain
LIITPDEIEELRKLKGWTVKDLADRYHKSPMTAARWTTGLSEPSWALQRDMKKLLDKVKRDGSGKAVRK